MKKYRLIAGLVLISFASAAQLRIVPYAGIASPRMKLYHSHKYEKGGNFPAFGLDVEWRKPRREHVRHYFSLVTGLGYLRDDFYYFSSFAFTGDEVAIYEYRSLQITGHALQMPLTVRFNVQPFPLIDHYHLFAELGFNNHWRLGAHITEEYTSVSPPTNDDYYVKTGHLLTHMRYSEEASDLGNRYVLSGRLQIGIRYARIRLAFAANRSFTSPYFEGLESRPSLQAKTDGIPNAAYSIYVPLYGEWSEKPRQIHYELTFGFNLFREAVRYR